MVKGMAPDPIIFAIANPDPEISYDDAKAARPDAIVATGRSGYPNQVGFGGATRAGQPGRLICPTEAHKFPISPGDYGRVARPKKADR